MIHILAALNNAKPTLSSSITINTKNKNLKFAAIALIKAYVKPALLELSKLALKTKMPLKIQLLWSAKSVWIIASNALFLTLSPVTFNAISAHLDSSTTLIKTLVTNVILILS